MRVIPFWLKKYLSNSELKRIQSLVTSIEKQTSIELVPLIVKNSIDLTLPKLLLSAIGISLIPMIHSTLDHFLTWDSALTGEHLTIVYIALVLLMSFAITPNPIILRLFYGQKKLNETVFRRACGEYFENQLGRTKSRTAVLFMYSVTERKAIILADPELKNLPQDLWNQAMQFMLDSAKNKKLADGFENAMKHCLKSMQSVYPPLTENINELSDQVLIKV